jgi:hypothetical protein
MDTRLSDKYIAGFLDADGSIQIMWRRVDRADSNPELRRAYISLEFSQHPQQDLVLHLIQQSIGGALTEDRGYSILKLWGSQARMTLARIRKHMVIKRHYADVCLEMHGRVFNKREAARRLKEERRVKSLPLPNFPGRKWLAGYTDGDGCFQVRNRKDAMACQIVYEAAASEYDSEGLEIVHKNFGGSLLATDNVRKHILKYCLTLPPSKAKQFLGYFAKHLITKRDQAEFILGCAEMGHYRDSRSISAILKQLKAHPHRLNDRKIDVGTLLGQVDFSAETRRARFRRLYHTNGGCLDCGKNDPAYYSDGVCRACCDKRRWSKR